MIREDEITIVVQGNPREDIVPGLESVREVMPGVRLILSTFEARNISRFERYVDELVLSKDPGAFPPFTIGNTAAPNNLNRQLITSKAALDRVQTPYVLKMRTDCVLQGEGFTRVYEAANQNTPPDNPRLVASSFYTRHPGGIACYLFHVSDWFMFGTTEKVKRFFSGPLMSYEDATWFQDHNHRLLSTLSARRFRARYTPEQHISVSFARASGYRTPHFLNEINSDLVEEYRRFLRDEFVIASPGQLGFTLPKYAHLRSSLYEGIDCVSLSDWCQMQNCNTTSQSVVAACPPSLSKAAQLAPSIRPPAHFIRHEISAVWLALSGLMDLFRYILKPLSPER